MSTSHSLNRVVSASPTAPASVKPPASMKMIGSARQPLVAKRICFVRQLRLIIERLDLTLSQ